MTNPKRQRELVKLRSMALDLARLADGLLADNETIAPALDPWVPISETGLPDKTARRLIKTEQLHAKRVGRGYLVSRASVEAYLRAAEPTGAQDPLAVELGLVAR